MQCPFVYNLKMGSFRGHMGRVCYFITKKKTSKGANTHCMQVPS